MHAGLFLGLPEAIRQMIVEIWRAGVRARSVERQRPRPLALNLTHEKWLNDTRHPVNGMWRWPARMGAGNNAVAFVPGEHSYAYGGNPAHYTLTAFAGPDREYGDPDHAAHDRGTNMTDTFGNTLTKLIEYVLPMPPSRYSSRAEVNAENLRLRRIRRVRWVDRMI